MADPKKKVDDLIGPQDDVGAFVRSAVPTSFLYHALRFEEVEPMGYYLMTSPSLPVDSALAVADWYDAEDIRDNFRREVPSDGRFSWSLDYDRMLDLYIGTKDWIKSEGRAWQERARCRISATEYFASPKQALLSALNFEMVKKRIARYRLAEAENVDNQVKNAFQWSHRVDRVIQGMAGEGWRPAQVGTHKGEDTMFAVGTCGAEDPAKAELSFQSALGSVGLVAEGVRMVRRGGESGPWQVDFSVKEAEEPDFSEITPEEIAVPAVEAHPGVKSIKLLHAIHRAVKKRYPGLFQTNLDTSYRHRDAHGWPMFTIVQAAYKDWPLWGVDPVTGKRPVPVHYSSADLTKAILGAAYELGIQIRPVNRGMREAWVNVENNGERLYHAEWTIDPIEKFERSPYYQVSESRPGIELPDPSEFSKAIQQSTEKIPGFMDRQYLNTVKTALERAGLKVHRLLIYPLPGGEYAGRVVVNAHFSTAFYRGEVFLHNAVSQALEDEDIMPGNIGIYPDPHIPAPYGYMASWRTYTKGEIKSMRTINIGFAHEGIDIEPSAIAAHGMQQMGFEDFAKFKRLVGIILAHAPDGMLLSYAEDYPSNTNGGKDALIRATFRGKGMSPEAVYKFVVDAMDKLGMQPSTPSNVWTNLRFGRGFADIQIVYQRKSACRRVFGFDGDREGSLDDKLGWGIKESKGGYGTDWIQKGLKSADPWWEDRTRVSRASSGFWKAGFMGDVSYFPPLGNYTSFGSVAIHLKSRTPGPVPHRAEVAKRINPVLKRIFGFRLGSFQSISTFYDGVWRQPGPDTRKDYGDGWFTITFELPSTAKAIDNWKAPRGITLPISEDEEGIGIDPGTLLHQSDPRIKRRLMAIEIAQALKALGYRGKVTYGTNEGSPIRAYIDVRLYTGVSWRAETFEVAASRVLSDSNIKVKVQSAIYPILMNYGMNVDWRPDNPHASESHAFLYGDEVAIEMLLNFRFQERPKRYPYFHFETPIAESQVSKLLDDIEPDEVVQGYMTRWHYALQHDEATGAKFWLVYYLSMSPKSAVIKLRLINDCTEDNVRHQVKYMNWLMEQPGWDYMNGKWESPGLWLREAWSAGMLSKYAAKHPNPWMPESIVLTEDKSVVDPDELWKAAAKTWMPRMVSFPAHFPGWQTSSWFVVRGLGHPTNSSQRFFYGNSPDGVKRQADWMNWLEVNWKPYDPVKWPRVENWVTHAVSEQMDKKFNQEVPNTYPNTGEDAPALRFEESKGVDPDELWNAAKNMWRVTEVARRAGYYIHQGFLYNDDKPYYFFSGVGDEGRARAQRLADYMNWVSREWRPYDPDKWFYVSDWLRDSDRRGSVKKWMSENPGPSPLRESEDIDPQEIVAQYANRWRWAWVKGPRGAFGDNVQTCAVYRGLSPAFNTGYYDYQGYTNQDSAEYMAGLLNYAQELGDVYDPKDWADIRSYMTHLSTCGIKRKYDEARRKLESEGPVFTTPIQEEQPDELGIDPRALYKSSLKGTVEATKIPIRRMAKYLRELGYTGFISLTEMVSSLRESNYLHKFVLSSIRYDHADTFRKHVDEAIAASGYSTKGKYGKSMYAGYSPHNLDVKRGHVLVAYLPIAGQMPGSGYWTADV